MRVTGITDTEVLMNQGNFVTDHLGNAIRHPRRGVYSQNQNFIAEYSVGKRWTARYKLTTLDGERRDGEYEYKVLGLEKVTVPAGTFDALKVEGRGFNTQRRARLEFTYWIAPGLWRYVASTLR